MISLYKAATSLLQAAVYPYGRYKASRGRETWRGRLALLPGIGPKDVWIHAASVGEVKVIGFLIDYLRRRQPSLTIHVTVMTSAGFKTATSSFGHEVTVSYLPLDAPGPVRRTLDNIRPRMLVIAETEIWPNLINESGRRDIPILLVNGRMSEKAFARYKLFRKTMRLLFSGYDRFFFKTIEDQSRYHFLGVPPDKSVLAGDMKFDAPPFELSLAQAAEIRQHAGVAEGDFIFVAGSTRSGEEAMLLRTYKTLRQQYPQLRLVLAPRHLERVDEVKQLIEQEDLGWVIFGGGATDDHANEGAVILVDRMGLLNNLYYIASLAFVGGTLVQLGGHNILEPVWAGTPVVYGPYLDNVREAAQYVESSGYGAGVQSEDELKQLVADSISARKTFKRKTGNDMQQSATAQIGNYIIERLSHA